MVCTKMNSIRISIITAGKCQEKLYWNRQHLYFPLQFDTLLLIFDNS